MIILNKNEIIFKEENGDETSVSSVIPFLNEEIEIENGFVLEDFFKILSKDKEIYEMIFSSHMGQFPLQPYIDDCFADCPMDDINKKINHLEVYWEAESWDDKKFFNKHTKSYIDKKEKGEELTWLEESLIKDFSPPDNSCLPRISITASFHGWGLWYDLVDDDGENPFYGGMGLSFYSLNQIKHLQILLNKNFKLYDAIDEKNIIHGEKEFKVFDFFGAILSEITFYGLPEDRNTIKENNIKEIEEFIEKNKEENHKNNLSSDKKEE